MPVHRWQLDRAGELAACYNRVIAGVPDCYPQTPETFARGVPDDLAELFGFRRTEAFESEQLLVAEDGGRISGFADVGVHPYEESGETKRVGVIRFLACDPGRRRSGEALLEAAESELGGLGMRRISAFPKGFVYHFCSPEGGISQLAANVVGLMGTGGYEISGRTVNMVRDGLEMDEPSCPDPAVAVTVNRGERPARFPTVMLDADVGQCLGYPWDYVQDAAEAHDQLYINWMGIGRDHQGRGWGRYFLWKTLSEAKAIGYRACVLGTNETNHRALQFYANYGFRVTHTSFSYTKDLER